MGLFKQIKDMKNMVETAPEMIRNAQAMGAQAQELAAAQRAAAAARMASGAQSPVAVPLAGGAPTEPIAGISLALYAEISKGLAAFGYDQSKAVEVAASKGVSSEGWAAALDGWNARIKADRAVAQEFNRLYTGR